MIKEFNLRFVIAEEIEFKAEIRRPGRAEVFNEHFYEFLLVAFELNKHKSQSQFPFRMVITDRFLQLNSILEECFGRSSLSLFEELPKIVASGAMRVVSYKVCSRKSVVENLKYKAMPSLPSDQYRLFAVYQVAVRIV